MGSSGNLFSSGNKPKNTFLNNYTRPEPEKKEEKVEAVKVEKVVDTKLQEENDRLKRQLEKAKEDVASEKQKNEELQEKHEVEKKEQEEKIKKLEERKPAGRKPHEELNGFVKYSLNCRPEYLSFVQQYARMNKNGVVALVFDEALKDFIDKIPDNEKDAIKLKLREEKVSIGNAMEMV